MNKLNKWTRPQNYMGASWPEYYVFLGRTRDSDALSRSNFQSALRLIGGETDTVLTVCENHWAVGWVEWIAIHESDSAALERANEIADKLEDYPVVDEMDFSNEEFEEACESWENMDIRERVEMLQEHRLCIFAARSDSIPEGLPELDCLVSH